MRLRKYEERLKFLYQFETLDAAGAQFYKNCLLSKDHRQKYALIQQLEDGNKPLIVSHMLQLGYTIPQESLLWRLLGFFFAVVVYPLPWKLKMKGQYRLVRKGIELMEHMLCIYDDDKVESTGLEVFRDLLIAHEACFAVWYEREMDGQGAQAIKPVQTFIEERNRILAPMDLKSFDLKRSLPAIPRNISLNTSTGAGSE